VGGLLNDVRQILPRCHGNEMYNKIAYNSFCIRDISEILASNREFLESSSGDISVILARYVRSLSVIKSVSSSLSGQNK